MLTDVAVQIMGLVTICVSFSSWCMVLSFVDRISDPMIPCVQLHITEPELAPSIVDTATASYIGLEKCGNNTY